ncbi:reticuline oxidase [Rhizoctonia solani]|uniref:Reticuline oxidase n=1 Tax=Rhizoctonia solani TaxID=456999 RepID=A0A8H8NLR3_9AGAM|nr:reticuline oxidase [Rhizoctonia solani]QRW15550.1 reticuline oxidase [Rhizoctonia solani]
MTAELDEIHDDFERDSNFENDEPEKEEHQPPPRKRQRTITKPNKNAPRKKQVRGKQGGLADLINMPIDIFTEIAAHLLPIDIINLARSNKFFRSLLMHRTSIHIWNGAMKNIEGLPPCPPGMSEPRYLSLLFSKTCTKCGGPARGKMDPNLLVRLCGSCRGVHLMPLELVPSILMPMVHYSGSIAPLKRRSIGYTLCEDISDLLAQYQEKKQASNADELEAWSNEMRKAVHNRQNQAQALRGFLVTLELEREQELGDAKEARRSEIKRRLGEMGWAEEDMNFGWWSDNPRTWHDLVSQPKPLTERIWANIRPKLIPLLEDNRERRLEMEQPALDVSHRDAFPDFAHTLNWSIVKDIFETDATEEEMEVKFGQHRDEIRALITEWKDQVHTRLASSVRNAFEERNEPLRPTISVFNEEPDTLANISDNLKLLLRADSFFRRSGLSSLSKQPLGYSMILSMKDLVGSHSPYASETPRELPTFNDIEWQARCVPSGDEESWVCVRLWKVSCSWIDVVGSDKHKQIYAKIQEAASGLSERGIVYNDVHDPELFTDKPMITDYATKALETGTGIVLSPVQVCKLCEDIPAATAVITIPPRMKKHLLDVHGIAEPKINEHYISRNWNNRLPGMDDSDSDDSYSMGYGGCSCPFHQMMGGLMYSDEEDEYGYEEDDGGFGLGLGLGLGYSDDDDDDGDDMVDYW